MFLMLENEILTNQQLDVMGAVARESRVRELC